MKFNNQIKQSHKIPLTLRLLPRTFLEVEQKGCMCAHVICSSICLGIPPLIGCSTKVRAMETALKLENIKSSA